MDDMILEPDSDGADDDDDGGEDGEDNNGDELEPAAGPTAPLSTAASLPLAPNVADANIASTSDAEYNPASNDVVESSKPVPGRQVNSPVPRSGEGWYVAHNAVLPGVYFGV